MMRQAMQTWKQPNSCCKLLFQFHQHWVSLFRIMIVTIEETLRRKVPRKLVASAVCSTRSVHVALPSSLFKYLICSSRILCVNKWCKQQKSRRTKMLLIKVDIPSVTVPQRLEGYTQENRTNKSFEFEWQNCTTTMTTKTKLVCEDKIQNLRSGEIYHGD